MDPSAQITMKDAAKCDKRCEWQNSANQENAERILRFQVVPESMSVSEHLYNYEITSAAIAFDCSGVSFLCVSDVKTVDALNAIAAMLSAVVPSEQFVLWHSHLVWIIGCMILKGFPFCQCMKSDKATR